MNTSLLEARLASNPKSPLFARLASCYLKEERIAEAVALCVEGLKSFPDYSTGHLILGQCYEAQGRNVEALLEYRRVLKAVPDNPRVKSLVVQTEEREQKAFKAFAEERARTIDAKKGSLTLEGFLSESLPPKATKPTDDHPERPSEGTAHNKIVTPTLAEIYASQGEYGEAIEAYRRLLRERPGESQRFQTRIGELEDLAKAQQAESKS
jgi:tetratricopeptide (TPR) repeat protein